MTRFQLAFKVIHEQTNITLRRYSRDHNIFLLYTSIFVPAIHKHTPSHNRASRRNGQHGTGHVVAQSIGRLAGANNLLLSDTYKLDQTSTLKYATTPPPPLFTLKKNNDRKRRPNERGANKIRSGFKNPNTSSHRVSVRTSPGSLVMRCANKYSPTRMHEPGNRFIVRLPRHVLCGPMRVKRTAAQEA